MKKSLKRILCGALSFTLVGAIAVEYAVKRHIENGKVLPSANEGATAFNDVTGKYDATALREEYFNAQVLSEKENKYETRSVIVRLKGDALVNAAQGESVAAFATTDKGQRLEQDIAQKQDEFLKKLSAAGIAYQTQRCYDTVMNGVAITVDTKYVSYLKAMKEVESVVIPNTYLAPETTETDGGLATAETGIYNAENYGEFDDGTVVAVIDTGIDLSHAAFGVAPQNPAWTKAGVETLLAEESLNAEKSLRGLGVDDVYKSAKIPFAYDYADNDTDVTPSYSQHGTHVSGILGGCDEAQAFRGVLPDAQLVVCKVFTDNLKDDNYGSASVADIIAALEDCVTLGVDAVNMSLGSACGFTTKNDGDSEYALLFDVCERVREMGISLVCAANNDYSAGYGNALGLNAVSNPDTGTVGSPSTFASATSVASVNGDASAYFTSVNAKGETIRAFYENARDIDGNRYDFAEGLLGGAESKELEYVVVPGKGTPADYTVAVSQAVEGKIALMERGGSSFADKVKTAMSKGALGVIVYNNVEGVVRMNLNELKEAIPAAAVPKAVGLALCDIDGDGAKDTGKIGKLTVSKATDGPYMSEFSSWGPTHDLHLKPDITAPGGSILSSVADGYERKSGTSMAAPNMAGMTVLVRQYVKSKAVDFGIDANDEKAVARVADGLIMSTATVLKDGDGATYSPRKQGAGLGNLSNALEGTGAYLFTQNAYNNYRPKLELFDDAEKTGVYGADGAMQFSVKNFSSTALTFKTTQTVLTDKLSADGRALTGQSYTLSPALAEWSVDGVAVDGTVELAPKQTLTVSVKLTLSEEDKKYLENYPNGAFVEGYLTLQSQTQGQCDLGLPFMAFYGDWEKTDMLDVSAYETSADGEKKTAEVYATQPYAAYQNGERSLPMGGYAYKTADGVTVHVNEAYNAISRYNDYYGRDNEKNYMTTTSVSALRAGLLRNAELVNYAVYNDVTGEKVFSSSETQVVKAFYKNGNATPAKLNLGISPNALGLVSGVKYRVDAEFYMNNPQTHSSIWTGEALEGVTDYDNAMGTYSFTFTVDYDAPVLQDVRVRYVTEQSGDNSLQRIILEADVYDNHYAQALMLCYATENADGKEILQLATEYPTRIENPKKNGVTTVSMDITDIYQQYGNRLFIQLDDYAMNSCTYEVDIDEANKNAGSGGEFGITGIMLDEDGNIPLELYQVKQIYLTFGGNGSLYNYVWESSDPSTVAVRKGEIVGLKVGEAVISVSDGRGRTVSVKVIVKEQPEEGAVDENEQPLPIYSLPQLPTLSWNTVVSHNGVPVKPSAENAYTVRVKAGQEIALSFSAEPWYFPMENVAFGWRSTDEAVATVSQNGVVKTLQAGVANVVAEVLKKGENGEFIPTGVSLALCLSVDEEFEIKNNALVRYYGTATNVVIPADKNIFYIGENAFKDNKTVQTVTLPASVQEIRESAFENCVALKEVRFAQESELSLIDDYAFYRCAALRSVDLTGLSNLSVGNYAFANCEKLETVTNFGAIYGAYNYAFANCTALATLDLSALRQAGKYVFSGCTALSAVTLAQTTPISAHMFDGCAKLSGQVTLYAQNIGAYAFANCGLLAVAFGAGVRSIGDYAFQNTNLQGELVLPESLHTLGVNAFEGTKLASVRVGDGFAELALTGDPFKGLAVNISSSATRLEKTDGVIYGLENGAKTKALYADKTLTGEVVLPDTVTEIAPYAFYGAGITSIQFPQNLTAIGKGAFENCAALLGSVCQTITPETPEGEAQPLEGAPETETVTVWKLVLPESLVSVGEKAFFNATAITELSLPSIKEMGAYAFANTGLKYVTFGENAETTGAHTFENCAVLDTIDLASAVKIESVGAYFAKNSPKLREVELSDGVVTVERNAFEDCRFLHVINLQNLVTIEPYAFHGAYYLRDGLDLQSAKIIGEYAFYSERYLDGNLFPAEYKTVNIPVVEEIGDFAFKQGGETTIVLPQTVRKIGEGAFAHSTKLTSISFADGTSGNEYFFVDNGALYRYVNGDKNVYELIAYPGGLLAENQEYTVLEGTVRIGASAFEGLTYDAMRTVWLPSTLKTVGDAAFFGSHVRFYHFESTIAPTLETVYRPEIEAKIQELADKNEAAQYKGYYHANFYGYVFDMSRKDKILRLYRPADGVGYDDRIYDMYFYTWHEEQPTQATKDCVARLTALSVESIDAWLDNGFAVNTENKALVEAFCKDLRDLRIACDTIAKDTAQAKYIGAELIEKLTAAESKLKQVKAKFGIVAAIDMLSVAKDSKHKSRYTVGDDFDITGLVIDVTYDDGTSKQVAQTKKQLKLLGENKPLTKYDSYVEIGYYENDVLVGQMKLAIVVAEPSILNDGDITDPAVVTGLGIAIMAVGAVLIVVGALGVRRYLLEGKETAKKN